MYIEYFEINNFLNFVNKKVSFNNRTFIDDEDVLKSFYIFKFLLTLSEEHLEIAKLIHNEKKPYYDKNTSFKIIVNINNNKYSYEITVFNGEIINEYLKCENLNIDIFHRINNEVICLNEPLVWNCPNNKYKSFLNTCATKDNEHGINFFFSFKEKILGIGTWISTPLNDEIKKLFRGEDFSLKELLCTFYVNKDDLYKYENNVDKLNSIIKYNFSSINDLNARKFMKFCIYLQWLYIIEGGILVFDEKIQDEEKEIYLNVLSNEKYKNIQIIYTCDKL